MNRVIVAMMSVTFAVFAETGCSVSPSTLNCRGRGQTVFVCQADLWSPSANITGGCTESFRKPFCASSEGGADYLFSAALRTFVAGIIRNPQGWRIITACVDTKTRSYTSNKTPPRPTSTPSPVPTSPGDRTEGLGGGSIGTWSGVGGGLSGPAATVGAGGGSIQDSTGSGFEPVGTCMLPDVSGAGGGSSVGSGFGGAVSLEPGVGGGI